MEPIDSITDKRIAVARNLDARVDRQSAGRCLIEGAGLIRQVVAAGSEVDYVLYAAGIHDLELQEALTRAGVSSYPVREGLLRKVTRSAKPVDWLAVVILPAEAAENDPYGDFAVICERVADPGNLGTITRTARALGVKDIVLTDEETDLSSRRVLAAARGAVLDCRVRRFTSPKDALKSLRDAGFQIVVTSPRGKHLQSMAPLRRGKVALVVGNETEGVSDATAAMADLVVQIPMAGSVESLNVGVATGISIYELRMRMILAMLTDHIRDTLGRDLNLTGYLVRQAFDARLREIGDLTSAQVILLMVLACEERTPLSQLRQDLGVDEEELSNLIGPLRARAYLTIVEKNAAITIDGEHAIAALWAVQERTEEELYAGFGEAERDQLRDLLHRIQTNAMRIASS